MLTFAAPTLPPGPYRTPHHPRIFPTCTAKPPPRPSAAAATAATPVTSAIPESSVHLPVVRLDAPTRLSELHDLRTYPSPLIPHRPSSTFIRDDAQVLRDIVLPQSGPLTTFLRAGPRKQVFFPVGVRAAIVSCGGLCPGINTVIRELVYALNTYHADTVYGIKHGFRGFYTEPWMTLAEADVEGIHHRGGSVLGSSRGGFDLNRIVDALEQRTIDMVFVIGGDGTIMGCHKIFEEICRRKLKCAVVSVPKTIDNDIALIDCSFGFETAVDEAQRSINAAYVEATSFPNCVGIVKLSKFSPLSRRPAASNQISVGRNSGFIACHASYASRVVDICLVPEEPFLLHGKGGVLEHVSHLLDTKGYCVLVVAEGAGNDTYGNVDIGLKILQETKSYFRESGREISPKYLDPTYQIRAIPTTTHDNMLCVLVAHAAVHGAFAGYTGFSTGPVNNRIAMIPLHLLAGIQRTMDTDGSMWQRLRMSTGQPTWNVPDTHKKQ